MKSLSSRFFTEYYLDPVASRCCCKNRQCPTGQVPGTSSSCSESRNQPPCACCLSLSWIHQGTPWQVRPWAKHRLLYQSSIDFSFGKGDLYLLCPDDRPRRGTFDFEHSCNDSLLQCREHSQVTLNRKLDPISFECRLAYGFRSI